MDGYDWYPSFLDDGEFESSLSGRGARIKRRQNRRERKRFTYAGKGNPL